MIENPSSEFNLKARDDRFFRAAYSVMKHYRIRRRPEMEDGMAVFDVTGGSNDYVVSVHPDWAVAPHCTCPDAEERARDKARGYCKHIIAVLLSNKDLSYQLLEAFL